MKRIFLLLLVVTGSALIVFLLVRKETPDPLDEVLADQKSPISEVQESNPRNEAPATAAIDFEEEMQSPKGPPTFKSGSLEIILEFEDSSLDAMQAHRIAEDLNNVFSHLTADLASVGDRKRLVFKGKGRTWPDALDTAWMIRGAQGGQVLNVPKSVSDEYKKAFDFIEQHEIHESEVSDLVAGVEMGISDIESVVVLSVQSVPDEKLSEALEEMAKGRVKPPSALAYRLIDANGSKAVIAETLFLQLDGDVVTHAESVGVIRVGGEWKIAL